MRMTIAALVFLLELGTTSADAVYVGRHSTVVINPHIEPAGCLSCHQTVPDAQDATIGEYHLLKESINQTCTACHPDIDRSSSGHNHPTVWRKPSLRYKDPEILPLFKGYITCNTCHLHRYSDKTSSPKLLRIGTLTDNGTIDFRELCYDCHDKKFLNY